MTSPANQRKLEVVDQLSKLAGDAGMTLIELAIAFVINLPAVTAAIIDPRTMEQFAAPHLMTSPGGTSPAARDGPQTVAHGQ